MTSFDTRRQVRHSAQQMFDLVASVESYPEFVPLCEALVVRERRLVTGVETLVADMTCAYGPYRETFRSRVRLDRPRCEIRVEYLDGPFRYLENDWRFRDRPGGGSLVDFHIAYELRSLPLQLLVGALFDRAFRKLAGAFEARADLVYAAAPLDVTREP